MRKIAFDSAPEENLKSSYDKSIASASNYASINQRYFYNNTQRKYLKKPSIESKILAFFV